MYKVISGRAIKCGNKMVPAFHVVDEVGGIYCNESSEKRAQSFIQVLQNSDKVNAEAVAVGLK